MEFVYTNDVNTAARNFMFLNKNHIYLWDDFIHTFDTIVHLNFYLRSSVFWSKVLAMMQKHLWN